nr:TatD family hydrolase [Acidobacteriota bacterium]
MTLPRPAAPLFDTHAHLDFPGLAEDLDGLLARARAAGVTRVVSIGAGRQPGVDDQRLARLPRQRDLRAERP